MIIDLLLSMRVTCLWPPSEYEGHGGDSPRGLEWLISPAWLTCIEWVISDQYNPSQYIAYMGFDMSYFYGYYNSHTCISLTSSAGVTYKSLLWMWLTSTDMIHFYGYDSLFTDITHLLITHSVNTYHRGYRNYLLLSILSLRTNITSYLEIKLRLPWHEC